MQVQDAIQDHHGVVCKSLFSTTKQQNKTTKHNKRMELYTWNNLSPSECQLYRTAKKTGNKDMWKMLNTSLQINMQWPADDSTVGSISEESSTNSTPIIRMERVHLGSAARLLLDKRREQTSGRSRAQIEGTNLIRDVPKYSKDIFKEYKFIFQVGDLDYDKPNGICNEFLRVAGIEWKQDNAGLREAWRQCANVLKSRLAWLRGQLTAQMKNNFIGE
jgi:hypothetical protein